MLQQEQPDDYVIATGETHSVREFIELAFDTLDLNWEDYVEVDPRLCRPTEVDLLLGDASKARQRLGWQPKIRFAELVRMMVESDWELARHEAAEAPARRLTGPPGGASCRNSSSWTICCGRAKAITSPTTCRCYAPPSGTPGSRCSPPIAISPPIRPSPTGRRSTPPGGCSRRSAPTTSITAGSSSCIAPGGKLAGFRQKARPLAFIKRYEYVAKQLVYQARVERVKRAYGAALDEIWTSCSPRPGDLLFLPTTTAIDLAGVADWARRHPAAGEVDWHFNLHFPLVNLETWYGHSVREFGKLLLWWPEFLADLAAALPAERVHLYTTSELMGLQLQHFLGRQFEILPYPVNPALSAPRADDAWRVLTGRGRPPQGPPAPHLVKSRQSSSAL